MNFKKEIKNLLSTIQSAHRIRIVSHKNPDGDALGSMIAFAHICNFYHLDYDLVLLDSIPKNLLFMMEQVNYSYFSDIQSDDLLNEQTDTVVCLDCGQLDRIGIVQEYLLPHQKIINIDHHISNPLFGEVNIVEDISSTSELLFYILQEFEIVITPFVAQALYIGILTDTGLFQYDKVTSQIHFIISELMKYEIDPFYIYQNIYQNNPISCISLLKKGLEVLEFFDNDSIAIMCFQHQDISINSDLFDDTHILFPIMLSINSIKVCAILKEKEDNLISVSLRSKDDTDVATIAKLFNGGGHKKAAGCRTSEYSLSEVKKMLYHEIKKYII